MAEKKKAKERGIRERDGKFYYRHSVKDPVTGKRKQKETPGFFNIGEARREGIRIEAEKLHGTYIEEQDISFVDWCDKWLAIYAATGKVKNATVKLRRKSLIAAKRYFKGLKLNEVTKLIYESMFVDMKENGNQEKFKNGKVKVEHYSKRTIELLHEACGIMFDKAVALKLIKESPAEGADLPAFQQTVEELEAETELPEYLEKEELALLLRTAAQSDDQQGYHALYVLAYTGLRIGELCALKATDIDHINKIISITKTLYDGGKIADYDLNTPKTKTSIRKIDVSDSVLVIINKQIAWRKEFKMSVRSKFSDKQDKLNFLFINNKQFPGYPANITQFEIYMKTILSAARLSNALSPHSLRHTYCSLMAEAKVELEAIQAQLGHKQGTAVTRAIYMHVTKSRRKADVAKLDELMKGL
jgi:integrase